MDQDLLCRLIRQVQLDPDFERIEDGVRQTAPPSYHTGSVTPRSPTLAQRVFGIFELAKHTLSFLDLEALLKVQQVNKKMRDVVDESKKLSAQLFLQVSTKGHLRIPDLPPIFNQESHGLKVKLQSIDHSTDGRPFTQIVQITFKSAVPQLGTKVRKIHVCEPRVRCMTIFPSCCARTPDRVNSVLEREDGVTLGDLVDTAREIQVSHRSCSRAKAYQRDEDGNVRVVVNCYTIVQLEEEDPLITIVYPKLLDYSVARNLARTFKLPHPTLAEYEALLLQKDEGEGDEKHGLLLAKLRGMRNSK